MDHRGTRSLGALLLVALMLCQEGITAPARTEDPVKLYEYDRSLSLEAEEELVEKRNGYKLYKVRFNSVNEERVPALLAVPLRGSPPYPCIVMLHGYGGSKEDMLDFASLAAENGYAMMAIDAQFHGERKRPGKALYSINMTRTRDGIIQTVIDARRAVDYLESRQDIDPTRIALVGGSMGAIIGALFAGVESRVKAAVLIVGGGNMSLMVMESEHPAIPPIREHLRESGITYEEIQKALDPVDPLNFVDKIAPRPLLMHNGKHDTIVPAEAGRQLYEKARQPKKIYWYDAGHDVPLQLVALRTLRWLDENLTGRPTPLRYLILEQILRIPLRWLATLLTIAAIACGAIIARSWKK